VAASRQERARDERLMRRALQLATRGLGETNPNPVVGCVVARGGRVVGEGFHRRAGGEHAELPALRQAGPRARGATLYVTLEPCAHHGRTPPCAPLVASAGLARVVVAVRDPDPRVSGRGLRLLRRAGASVSLGACAAEAEWLNRRFLKAARTRRPFVLLKAALTLDGRIATAAGRSRWITSPAARREARRLRRLHDAVLVGIGTVLADDPLLLPEPRTRRTFTRVVLDTRLRLPPRSRLARSATARAPVVVLTARPAPAARRRALEALGVTVVELPAKRRLPPARALVALFARGITSVMVEGGAEVLGSFLHARLVDEVALFRAPLLLGGRGSLGAFGGEDPLEIAEALRLEPAPDTVAGLSSRSERLVVEYWRPARRYRRAL
jgi:diaminohydroxyphosphoribosylaminopyrimidine deaminase/5-amino-6-(5-phosphoribosylamino)uracil reductase